jgi:hypothetical protein
MRKEPSDVVRYYMILWALINVYLNGRCLFQRVRSGMCDDNAINEISSPQSDRSHPSETIPGLTEYNE